MSVPSRGPGFTAAEVTGMLSAGMTPRAVRDALFGFPDFAAWIDSLPSGEGHRRPQPVAPDSDSVVLGATGYPAVLARLSAPPPILYFRGDLAAATTAVGVVGAREMSRLGEAVARAAVDAAALVGAPVVSGLARGVDTLAHRRALERGLSTFGFTGGSLGSLHGPHLALADAIVADGGCVLSEVLPGREASTGSLMARNRLIAASSYPLIPCEARLPSGTTSAVRDALTCGTPVVVPLPRPGHREHPGARGLLAVAGFGETESLGWSKELTDRAARGAVANAVARTPEDLALFVRILWWMSDASDDLARRQDQV